MELRKESVPSCPACATRLGNAMLFSRYGHSLILLHGFPLFIAIFIMMFMDFHWFPLISPPLSGFGVVDTSVRASLGGRRGRSDPSHLGLGAHVGGPPGLGAAGLLLLPWRGGLRQPGGRLFRGTAHRMS